MSKGWTKAQKEKYRATMLKKKAIGNLEKAVDNLETAKSIETGYQAAVDVHKIREQSYRSGLVAAMECILRELR